MRVLVVDDDRDTVELLKEGLEREAFVVDLAYDGIEALARARESAYNVILLDVVMPRMDGYRALDNLRQEGIQVPVIMLTNRGAEQDKLKGFHGGADDYIVKPCRLPEIVARVRAVAARKPIMMAPGHPTMLEVGGLRLDLLKHTVTWKGKLVELTKKEFELLACFMQRPGEVLTKAVLAQHLTDSDFDRDPNFVEALVHRLRDKISQNEKPLIETLRGIGYRLNV